MMRAHVLALAVLAAVAMASSSPVAAAHAAAHRHEQRSDRDCTPLNGFYGYYGNPWCDTGSYRLDDIWFRERQRFYQRRYRADR